jgi:hypothetical protein
MEKVIPLIKLFKTIIYSKFFEFGKVSFASNHVGTDLNYFEFYLNCSRTHLPFSPPPSYSWAPHPGRPTCQLSSCNLCSSPPRFLGSMFFPASSVRAEARAALPSSSCCNLWSPPMSLTAAPPSN